MKNIHVSLLPVLACIAATLLLLNLNPAANNKPDADGDGKKERPYSFGHKVKKLRKVPVIESGVTKQMLKEHLEKEADNSMQVALSVNVHHKASEVGLWERLPDGGRLWRVGICSENAKGIGFMLYDFRVPEGAKLFAYNKNRDFVVGPIGKTNSPIKESRVRYAPVHVNSIMGEEIYLEYYEPASAKGNVDFYIMQISHRWGDFPYGMTHQLQTKPEVKTVPITQEDYDKYLKTRGPNIPNMIRKEVNYDLSNSGTWEELPNGDRIWRLIIEAPDFGVESHLVPYFETMLIPPGAKLFVYDPDGMAIYGAMVKRNHNVLYMPGNTMIVEYYEPKAMKGKGRLNIMYAKNHLWVGGEAKSLDCTIGNAYLCTAEVNCGCIHGTEAYIDDPLIDDDEEITCSDLINQSLLNTLKNSVVRIALIAPDGSSAGTCSGTLIANKHNRLYVLTGNHCLRNPSDWDNWHYGVEGETGESTLQWEFFFNYESSINPADGTCTGSVNSVSVVGGKVIATSGRTELGDISNGGGGSQGSAGSDFALIELDALPEIEDIHFAGWNGAKPLDDVLAGCGIHHPGGSSKKVSIQDDALYNVPLPPDNELGVCEENNGLKPFSFFTGTGALQKDVTENNDGEFFAVTFDRGITQPGSSGSAFFDETGKIRGQLRGASPSLCCATRDEPGFEHEEGSLGDYLDDNCNPTSNIADAKKYRNGNTERYSEYGRLWYSFNQVNPNALPVLDSERRTLQPWLDPNNETDGMLEGIDVTDCDIYMRDGYCDDGNEPNFDCNMGGWDDIWASPDLWSTSFFGGTESEEINPSGFNYMGYRIHNDDACTSAPALLHLYWTMASTGEMWADDWVDDIWWDGSTIVCPYGNEMANSPVQIPAISPGGEHQGWMEWFPPYYTIYPEPNSYDPDFCEINPDVENGQFEICLLARIASLDNPIRNEAEGPIAENVLSSNNIVTRNTFLVEVLPGEAPKPHCILVTNNNSIAVNLNITFEQVARELNLDYGANTTVELLPSISLWDSWQSTGAKSQGLQITGNRVVEVTDFASAKLLDIPFEPKEQKPLCVKVYDSSGGSSSGKTGGGAAQLTFKIAHEPANPNDHLNASSACVFKVNRKSEVSIGQSLQMRAHPNPFSAQTKIVFSLPDEAPVSLNIYDLKGRLVQTLAAGNVLPEGEHTLLWNAQALPKGVYIAMLETPLARISAKIVKTR